MTFDHHKYFQEVIQEHRILILKVCRMFRCDEAGQKDLYQDICVNIWKGLPGYKGISQMSTWLYRVAFNTALSQNRKLKRNPLYQAEVLEDRVEDDLRDDKEDKIKALYAGIALLRPVEKAIILLYLEEKSYEEIAGIVGISKTNVSVKLVRIKKKLEDIINSYLTKRGTKNE
jgi:RNA polymerase sigma-70 factor, ECF subfamily